MSLLARLKVLSGKRALNSNEVIDLKHYTFPAVFTQEDRGISIEFPNLPGCLPCADDLQEAFRNAKEALHLHLRGMIADEEKIPAPSRLDKITLGENTALALIEVTL